jgi:hypothetical protein
MSTTTSPEQSASLKRIETYFDRRLSKANRALGNCIVKLLPAGQILDPQIATVDLLSVLESMRFFWDTAEFRRSRDLMVINAGLLEIDERTERMRILPLTIKDLVLMKEREFGLLKGQEPVQSERCKLTSHTDIRIHYQARVKMLNDELAAFGSYNKQDWGKALWGKWLDTAVKFRDIMAERERERHLGVHKGWGCGDYDYEENNDYIESDEEEEEE